MAEVRDFNAYKKRRQGTRVVNPGKPVPEKRETPAPQAKPHVAKRTIVFRTMSILIVLALLALISYFSWRDKKYTQANAVSSVNIPDAGETNCANLGGYVLQYSKDGVSCMQGNGEVIWNQTYEMQAPMLETCGNVAAIADYNGRTVYIMDTTAPIGEVHTNLPIRAFHVASQGVVAVVLDDTDVTWISLYDPQGTELASFRTTMGDSGYPLSVSLSPNGKMVCVSFLSVDGAYAKTSIAFYNFGEVGQNETDNFVGGFDYRDCIVPRVRFLDDSHLYAIATDRIMFFEGDQRPMPKTQTMLGSEEIRSVYESNGHVGVVFAGGSDEGDYRIQVYDADGKECFVRYFDMEYTGVLFGDRNVVLYNSGTWRIVGMDGSDKFEDSFDFTVKAVVPTSVRDRFLLVASDRIRTVELK
ncbi:MAG: hypothetical protein IJQ21_13665 [Lachnospiraceae bacterium]|nr:hypothetical protein [Lachnospiraceae bacterium]